MSLRRRRRIGMALWLGYLPGVFVLGWLLSNALGSGLAYLGVALAWMAACLLVQFWAGSFRCPRCGHRFYRKWGYQGSWARACARCGLARWAETEDGMSVPHSH
jgi:hypothetical protein